MCFGDAFLGVFIGEPVTAIGVDAAGSIVVFVDGDGIAVCVVFGDSTIV